MLRLRIVAASIVAILISTLAPGVAGANVDFLPSRESTVDFGPCKELATGTSVSLAELEARVPDSVPVLSLTDQGFVFPGSDDLGILITRTLSCESITVTRNGRTTTQYDRHIAHVGTPVDASVLPASPFNNDGVNGADFNNYIFAYYSDSWTYRQAMRKANVRPIAPARIVFRDVPAGECLLDRTVKVQPRTERNDYGFDAVGIVPDAECEAPVVPYIANWWSVRDNEASVLSNQIPGQAAAFLAPPATSVTLDAGVLSQLNQVFSGPTASADAFGISGYIPEAPGTDMIITKPGTVGGPLGGSEFTLQNYFSTPDEETGETVLIPFFDPIVGQVGAGLEVTDYLYDFDFTPSEITMRWDTRPDADLPEGAVPNDIYPPYVGAIAGISQEIAAVAGIADEYWFEFDRDISDLTFTVDAAQSLVPTVRVENGDTLVISVPGGTDIGDGFDARIIIEAH